MGLETAMLIGAGSQLLGTGMSVYEGSRQSSRQRRLSSQAQGMMQTQPTAAELAMQQLLAGFGNGSAPGMQGFNTGQDALAQMLRASAGYNGDPFDTSSQFAALEPIEAREQQRALGTLRGSAGSLGARFGSAFAGREATLLNTMTQDAASRRAGIAQTSYEAAQGRRLQSQTNALGAAGQMQQSSLAQQGLLQQIMAMLAQTEASRRGYNASLFGASAAMPTGTNAGQTIASGGADFATLIALMSGMNRRPTTAPTPPR